MALAPEAVGLTGKNAGSKVGVTPESKAAGVAGGVCLALAGVDSLFKRLFAPVTVGDTDGCNGGGSTSPDRGNRTEKWRWWG